MKTKQGHLILPRTTEDEAIIARLTYGRATSGADGHKRVGIWGENYTLTQDREYDTLLQSTRAKQ